MKVDIGNLMKRPGLLADRDDRNAAVSQVIDASIIQRWLEDERAVDVQHVERQRCAVQRGRKDECHAMRQRRLGCDGSDFHQEAKA